jgi:demethylmenaquinone methyltransferase/2-methoxy-6-polyprenyl-1,4-benzoquinol methylase
MLSRDGCAYQYLDASVRAFPEGQKFLDILKRTGYSEVTMTPLTLGICTIYLGLKGGAKILL